MREVEFHQVSLIPLLFCNSRVMLKHTPVGYNTEIRSRQMMEDVDKMILDVITKVWAKEETEIFVQRLTGFSDYFKDWIYTRLPKKAAIFFCKRYPIDYNYTRIKVYATYPSIKIKGEDHRCNFHIRSEEVNDDIFRDAVDG